jgi:hypothetical protein
MKEGDLAKSAKIGKYANVVDEWRLTGFVASVKGNRRIPNPLLRETRQ